MKNIFYDKSKVDYGNLLFPRRALWMLLIPLIIEQMLNSLMGMVDTLMVSRVGAEAISAVSLVDSINNLVLQVFAAMAAGAAITGGNGPCHGNHSGSIHRLSDGPCA